MKLSKKIGLIVLSGFMLYLGIELSMIMWNSSDSFSLIENCFLSALINLYYTGFFAFLGFALPSSKILPSRFYTIGNDPYNFLYQILGGKYFRLFLLATFWRNKAKQKSFFSGFKNGLHSFVFESKQAEFGHLMAFIFIALFSIIMAYKGHLGFVIICSGINIIFNFYPILLQRRHRIRINRITSRL